MSNIVKETSAAATKVQAPAVTTSAAIEVQAPAVQKRVVFPVMKETSGNHLF